MTKGNQEIVWDLIPTSDPDAVAYHDPEKINGGGKVPVARNIVNASTGSGMDILAMIVEEFIPVVDDPTGRTETLKEIIRTDRDECPCCNYDLTAIVLVKPQGFYCLGWEEVEGLYRVRILPGGEDCKVTVEKLSGTIIHESRTAFLPRKNYGDW